MTEIEKVYKEHFETVYKYVFTLCYDSSLAEEITQETFFKALKSMDSFKGECKLSVWLCQIAKNTWFTWLGKEKKNAGSLEDIEPSEKFSIAGNPESRYIDKETSMAIHKALHRLDEPYKEVFSLRTFGELSYKEIGDLFSKSESWARVTYHRAKLKIREDMK